MVPLQNEIGRKWSLLTVEVSGYPNKIKKNKKNKKGRTRKEKKKL